jgi:hypothetical protein
MEYSQLDDPDKLSVCPVNRNHIVLNKNISKHFQKCYSKSDVIIFRCKILPSRVTHMCTSEAAAKIHALLCRATSLCPEVNGKRL